jgi:hypothetical protein
MACNKEQKKNARYGFNSVASGSICVDEEDLAETINKIGYPIVLKPSMEITEKALQSMLIGKMLFWFRQKNTAGASSLVYYWFRF